MATAYAFGGAAEALPLYQPVPDFSGLIGNLGRESFGDDLLDLFESMTGADHCSVYHEKAYQFSEVMARSGQARSIYCDDHFSTYHVRQSFRKFAARHATVEILPLGNPKADTTPVITQPQAILITGQTDDGLFAVKLLRVATYSQNPDTTIDLLQSIADILISLIARHQSLSKSKSTGFSALASLECIENHIHSLNRLSRREAQVCARILYGFSSCEIASDLLIGKESVTTYRKRAYQHLEIGSQRELMLWYLEHIPASACH